MKNPYLDLVVANSGGSNVAIFLGNGAFNRKGDFGTGLKPVWLAVGDFNKDGNSLLKFCDSKNVKIHKHCVYEQLVSLSSYDKGEIRWINSLQMQNQSSYLGELTMRRNFSIKEPTSLLSLKSCT